MPIIFAPNTSMSTFSNFLNLKRDITCEEYRGCESSYLHRERDIYHYPYQGLTEVETHSDHLSAYQGRIGHKYEIKNYEKTILTHNDIRLHNLVIHTS